jgi:hypothetical protein
MKAPKTMLLATLLTVAIAAACATVAPTNGLTPEQEVLAVLTEMHKAEWAYDIERTMAVFSEGWEGPDGKPGVRAYFETSMFPQRVYDTATAHLGECEVTIDRDIATVKPVVYDTPEGKVSWIYRLKREADGKWRVVFGEAIQ